MPRPKSQISQVPLDRSIPHHSGAMLIEGIPKTTKSRFKAACARRGVTMRDEFIKFMRTFANKVENPNDDSRNVPRTPG